MDPGVALAALGITLLELSEAAAVAVAVYAESRDSLSSFGATALGALVVLVPTFLAGKAIELVPVLYVRLFSATLLLYFGLRLARSTRRTVLRSRRGAQGSLALEMSEGRGLAATAFSVGVTESLEAAIVLIALLPESYGSATLGFLAGALAVVAIAYVLKQNILKIRVALLKNFVSAMLLTFSAFWYTETLVRVSDLLLLPIFAAAFLAVYAYANR